MYVRENGDPLERDMSPIDEVEFDRERYGEGVELLVGVGRGERTADVGGVTWGTGPVKPSICAATLSGLTLSRKCCGMADVGRDAGTAMRLAKGPGVGSTGSGSVGGTFSFVLPALASRYWSRKGHCLLRSGQRM